MKFLLAKKVGMAQVFKDDRAVPVTVLQATPSLVTQIRISEKDGYSAVQVGFGRKKKLSKPAKGHLRDLNNVRWLREFRLPSHTVLLKKLERGSVIPVSVFEPGDYVSISGISKGKGFQGVMKRHGFRGGPKTHGQKERDRAPGSIGSTTPQRVVKGKKMAGRMGGERVTVRNLQVVDVDEAHDVLFVKGAVPGRRNALLEVRAVGLTRKGKSMVKESTNATS